MEKTDLDIPCICGHSLKEHTVSFSHTSAPVYCTVRNKDDSGWCDECWQYIPDNLGYVKLVQEEREKKNDTL
jgi:hypothetical protein